MRLLLEAERSGDPRSLFRLSVPGRVLAAGLTAAQAHLMVGDALEAYVSSERGGGLNDRNSAESPEEVS